MPAIEARPLLFDGRPNVANARAGAVHLSRFGRDIDADRALETVGFPRGDVALVVPRGDEAIFVSAVSTAFASTEARHVAQDFWMLCRKQVRGAHDIDWARRCKFLRRNRWKVRLLVRTQLRPSWIGSLRR